MGAFPRVAIYRIMLNPSRSQGNCLRSRLSADGVFDGHRIAREFEFEASQFPRPRVRERMIWAGDRRHGDKAVKILEGGKIKPASPESLAA